MAFEKPAEIIETWRDLFARLNPDRDPPSLSFTSLRGGFYLYYLGGVHHTFGRQAILAQIEQMRLMASRK